MPYSRLLETEADEVGLQLAAKVTMDSNCWNPHFNNNINVFPCKVILL